ncbi:MAG TPA: secretin N-terminal domain-containing protein [Caulobacteraceae bacterium]|nr:secretin N-terminal domain-containing protein [Caulobacteraceae bacterium]
MSGQGPRAFLRGRVQPLSLLLRLMALILFATPAVADITVPPPPPAVLTDVQVKDISPTESQLILIFTPKAPTYSIIQTHGLHPAIGFALSSRGPAARVPAGMKGLLQTVDFEQNDTILILRFATSVAVDLTAKPGEHGALILDFKTNHATQIATGDPGQTVGALPHEADPLPGEDGFEVVPLKYADVSEVVGLLSAGQTVKSNDNFVPHEPNFGSASMNGQQAYSAPPTSPDAQNQPVGQSVDDSIAVDRRLNAIILKGSPEHIARMKEKIAAIDVPVDSVILETQFVELDETGATNVGFNFQNTNGQIGQVTLTSEGFSPAGFQSARGIISGSLQASLFAQIQKGHGKIVSKPRIAAQSGGEAKIVTGDALPILTSITLSGVNGVSQQVQYVNVGVTLQIAPRVSSDGYVTSHVFCVVSSVTGYSQNYPTISQREAETSVTVRDGETFVIGGLTQDSDIVSKSKVPGVGDIPLLGEIFHLNNDTKAKTELYIVVTPRVVRHGEPGPSVAGS